MRGSNAGHSGQTKKARRVKGNVAKVLHKLYSDLERDGYKDTLAYLPDSELMKFSKDDHDGRKSVEIYQGKVLGLVYSSAEDQVVRKNATTGEISIIDEEFAKRHYSGAFLPPVPFAWNFDIIRGLRTPMAPRTLALVQFYCLLACNDQGWLDRDVPIPDHGSLCQALDTVRADWQFNMLVNKRPDHAAMYKIFNFGVFSEYASSSSEAKSQPHSRVATPEAVSEGTDDLFTDQGSRTPVQGGQASTSPSEGVSKNENRDTEPRKYLDAATNFSDSSHAMENVEQKHIGSASPQSSHAVSAVVDDVLKDIESSMVERFGKASPHRNGNNVLSTLAPASAQVKKTPSWFEVSNGIHLAATPKDKEESQLMGIICAPDAKALDLVRQNITDDKLAAIWTMDQNAFEQQDNTSFAMLKLSLDRGKISLASSEGSVFAYIGSGWNKFLRPNLTFELESQRKRSKITTVRLLLSKGEKTATGTSYDIDNLLRPSKANDMRELTAIVMYAFLLAHEASSHGWQDNIVPIYPGFLLDLHRLGSRLLENSTATASSKPTISGDPGSSLHVPQESPSASSFIPSSSDSSVAPVSETPKSTRRLTRDGDGRVAKPNFPVFSPAPTPRLTRDGDGRVAKPHFPAISPAPSYTRSSAIRPPANVTPYTPANIKKSKGRKLTPSRLEPKRRDPSLIELMRRRERAIEERKRHLQKQDQINNDISQSDSKISKLDAQLQEMLKNAAAHATSDESSV